MVATVQDIPNLVSGQIGVVSKLYTGLGFVGSLEFVGLLALTLAQASGIERGLRRLTAG